MPTSQNGYPANDRSLVASRPIPGTKVSVTVRKDEAGDLLLDMAAWVDAHVEDIDNARSGLDDWGYAERPIRGSSTDLSNHASGTAIDLNATRHPLGKRGTFTPRQAAKIRERLAVYEGCIRWGGDYSGRPDEMHFEINRPLADVRRVARKLQEDDVRPQDIKDIAKATADEIMRRETGGDKIPFQRRIVQTHNIARRLDGGLDVAELADELAERIGASGKAPDKAVIKQALGEFFAETFED